MRQSGILAAAGIYALEHHFTRLSEDHEHARYFADELAKVPGMEIAVDEVETNLLYFGMKGKSPQWLEKELESRNVRVFAERPTQVRAVTHLGITREHLDEAVLIIKDLGRNG